MPESQKTFAIVQLGHTLIMAKHLKEFTETIQVQNMLK